ncbi:signal recognition particle-docking protein FtsY [Salidesulfovibrio brasiliensis]
MATPTVASDARVIYNPCTNARNDTERTHSNMAFFSKIKKLWQSPDEVARQAVEEYVQEKGIDVDLPEAAPEAAEQAAAEPVAAPTPETPAAEPVSEPVTAPEAPASEGEQAAPEDWQKGLVLALRQAEPKLSEWLSVILKDIDVADDRLWERLAFLFECLGAPKDEAQDFISRFKDWLDDMGYEAVEEFRSELQYRLALALDLEDEEDERDRLFLKLSEGISKTKETLTKHIDSMLASHDTMDNDFWEEFEEILIMADVGMEAANQLMESLKARARKAGTTNPEDFKDILREELEEIFRTPPRITAVNPPEVVMMIGVNGVGKTTTIAKLAHRAQMQGRKVLIAAGDTFRAAAIEQLEVWAGRIGAGFFAKEAGSDPAAVAYEAMDKCISEGYDLLLLDTAGRLHTKANLMEELEKIKRVVGKKHEGAPHRSVLVIDATTGQNALSQTKLFHKACSVDEIILTKLDGTAKGGVVVAVAQQFGLPITFVGLGEKMEDLRPFNGEDFAKALLT